MRLIGLKEGFTLANLERANLKMEKLSYDEKLAEIARNHSKDMVERSFFAHVNPDGKSPLARTSRSRYECIRKKYKCEKRGDLIWKGYFCETSERKVSGEDETKVTRRCNDEYCVTTTRYPTPGFTTTKTTCE